MQFFANGNTRAKITNDCWKHPYQLADGFHTKVQPLQTNSRVHKNWTELLRSISVYYSFCSTWPHFRQRPSVAPSWLQLGHLWPQVISSWGTRGPSPSWGTCGPIFQFGHSWPQSTVGALVAPYSSWGTLGPKLSVSSWGIYGLMSSLAGHSWPQDFPSWGYRGPKLASTGALPTVESILK